MPLPSIRPWWASGNGEDGDDGDNEDETDVEQASLLQDIKGRNMRDKEYMHSSPPSVPTPAAQAEADEHDDAPNDGKSTERTVNVPLTTSTHAAASHSITGGKTTQHIRSKSDTCNRPAQLIQKHGAQNRRDTRSGSDCKLLNEATQKGARLGLLLQFDKIAEERQAITARLQALNQEEAELLSILVSTIVSPNKKKTSNPQVYNQKLLEKTAVMNAITIKKSTRTLSAPAESTPSASRRRDSSSTTRRVRLAERTEESLADFDSTSLFCSKDISDSPIKPERMTKDMPRQLSPTKSKLPKRATKTTRVPTKFNDEEADGKVAKVSGAERGRPVTPRRELPQVAGGVVNESQVMDTPNAPKGYEVPFTVKRKKWDF